jgi:hypothetical protein
MKFFAPGPFFDERDSRPFGLGLPGYSKLKQPMPAACGRRDRSWRVDSRRWSKVGVASLLIAMAQSLCTAVLTISGIRVAIGLSALAAASGIYAPARGFHQDAIRIPMLMMATVGALVNLAVLAWIYHLRSRPSAQWRRRALSTRERRSEKLQIAMAILTLVLVGLETWTHPMVHRTGMRPPASQSGAS